QDGGEGRAGVLIVEGGDVLIVEVGTAGHLKGISPSEHREERPQFAVAAPFKDRGTVRVVGPQPRNPRGGLAKGSGEGTAPGKGGPGIAGGDDLVEAVDEEEAVAHGKLSFNFLEFPDQVEN